MKLRKVILFLFLFFGFFNLQVKSKVIEAVECEYTDAYNSWLLLSDAEKKNKFEPPKCKTNEKFVGRAGGEYGSSYDLRDYDRDSGRRNQQNSNSCWAFAPIASVESNLLVNDYGMYDLSEAHLELATQDSLFDSLMPYRRDFSVVGYAYDASTYFLNRIGPVLESQVPFQIELDTINGVRNATLSDISGFKAAVSVNSVSEYFSDYQSCSSSVINMIKDYVTSKGGLTARIIWDYDNYSDNHETYYYNSSTEDLGGHFVTIIGWDDTISSSSFSSKDGVSPSRNGAWLVKNSNNSFTGYNYISYDDVSICSELYGFYDVTDESDDNVYYYDELGTNLGFTLNSDSVYVANKYQKKSGDVERLKKVAIPVFENGEEIEIYFSATGTLTDKVLVYSGQETNIGYNTYDITDVNIVNDNFAIIVKYGSASSGTYVEAYGKDDILNSRFSKFDVVPGRSFISLDGSSWSELKESSNNFYASIKVYTDNITTSNNEFVATFLSDSGIESIANASASCTTSSDSCSIVLPSVNLNNGYRFIGWYTDLSNGVKIGDAGEEYTISDNVTLYAVSELISTTYTASFEYDNGVASIGSNSLSCTTSSDSCSIVLPNITVKSGYSLLGWYTASTGGEKIGDVGSSYTISNDITLYAVTKMANVNVDEDDVIYTVIFNDGDNSASSADKLSCTYVNNTCVITLPNIIVNSDYTVLGWYTTVDGGRKVGNPGDSYNVEGNITLYPRIIKNSSLDGGVDNNIELIVNKNPSNVDYEEGVDANIISNPDTKDIEIRLVLILLAIAIISFVVVRRKKV